MVGGGVSNPVIGSVSKSAIMVNLGAGEAACQPGLERAYHVPIQSSALAKGITGCQPRHGRGGIKLGDNASEVLRSHYARTREPKSAVAAIRTGLASPPQARNYRPMHPLTVLRQPLSEEGIHAAAQDVYHGLIADGLRMRQRSGLNALIRSGISWFRVQSPPPITLPARRWRPWQSAESERRIVRSQ